MRTFLVGKGLEIVILTKVSTNYLKATSLSISNRQSYAQKIENAS